MTWSGRIAAFNIPDLGTQAQLPVSIRQYSQAFDFNLWRVHALMIPLLSVSITALRCWGSNKEDTVGIAIRSTKLGCHWNDLGLLPDSEDCGRINAPRADRHSHVLKLRTECQASEQGVRIRVQEIPRMSTSSIKLISSLTEVKLAPSSACRDGSTRPNSAGTSKRQQQETACSMGYYVTLTTMLLHPA